MNALSPKSPLFSVPKILSTHRKHLVQEPAPGWELRLQIGDTVIPVLKPAKMETGWVSISPTVVTLTRDYTARNLYKLSQSLKEHYENIHPNNRSGSFYIEFPAPIHVDEFIYMGFIW